MDHPHKVGAGTGLRSSLSLPRSGALRRWFIALTLFQQFAIACTLVLGITMISLGSWISQRIADGVLRRSAEVGALYMESILEPHVQSLATHGRLSEEDIARLDVITSQVALRKHVLSVKVWLPDGTIAYSSKKELIGRKFPTTEIKPAMKGEISAFLSELEDDENVFERTFKTPLYEIYAPVYKSGTSEVIAVGEFYENAERLSNELFSAAADNWIVVGGSAVAMMLILFAIVYRGSAQIDQQNATLKLRFRQQLKLHRANERLQANVQEALRETARIDHQIQRRLGAELHDGPAQLIAFVLLRLDEIDEALIGGPGDSAEAQEVLALVRRAAAEALADLRSISTGLFLPYLDSHASVVDMINAILAAHERRTGIKVEFSAANVPERCAPDIVQCIGRVTQEALNNAAKYAGNSHQAVTMLCQDNRLTLTIRDEGPGMKPPQPNADGDGHLGLQSIKYRVESVGGKVEFVSRAGSGTHVVCDIPLPAINAEKPQV